MLEIGLMFCPTIQFLMCLNFLSGHDLEKLASFDLDQIPDVETLGHDMVRKMQHLMEMHYGHTDISTTLPEDQIQAVIVGVSSSVLHASVLTFN